MRRSPVAVVLVAAVLATLGFAATAFATMDKTIRLDVDGHQVTVRTFASDVAGVLRKANLALGAHDTVVPDPAAPVKDGSQVIVRHGRLLHLVLDGQSREVWVTALSVTDALDQLGLADRAWLSVSRGATIPRSGLSFDVREPQHVTVLVDGHRLVAHTTAPTVAALLRHLRVRVHHLDKVSAPLSQYPTAGLVITIDRIHQRMVTRSLAIPFHTKHVRTSSLYIGESKVTRSGEPGVRLNTYRLTWKNKQLVGQRLVRSRLGSHPVAEIVAVGTTKRPQYAPYHDGLNWVALAQCESGGNPQEISSGGEYRGLYQFTMGAWASVGGSGDPIDASSNEQTYRAQLLYRRSGDSVWPVCGHYLYT
ncbi:MAG TPA: ubiquitin-like domain-containing protein [Mycobacteriales bacterium]|nr:ubiquitin-like domain-containing protein [Mycobacteriales bacterium]